MDRTKKCLNPKCQKEFTPKNNKGVYCSGNCRAAHAYQMKRIPVNESKTIELPVDYVGVDRLAVLTADGRVLDISALEGLDIKQDEREKIIKWAKSVIPEVGEIMKLAVSEKTMVISAKAREYAHTPDNEAIQKQIDEKEKELKIPPKNLSVPLSIWKAVRELAIIELKKQLK